MHNETMLATILIALTKAISKGDILLIDVLSKAYQRINTSTK